MGRSVNPFVIMSQIIRMGCDIICKQHIMLYHNMQGYKTDISFVQENKLDG